MPSKIQPIYDNLGIDRKFTKRRYRTAEEFNSVKDNARLEEDCNFMIDLVTFPTARFGFKILVVCCDIATDEFDMVAVKNKEPETILKAFNDMMKRPYLKIPKYYMISDLGTEFQGVFHKYLYDNSIFHKRVFKDRHTQLANVDSLIAVLSRIFNGYMNEKEKLTNKVYKNWTDIIPEVREQLNEIRRKKLPDDIKEDRSQPLVNTTQDVEKIVVDKKGNKKLVVEKEFIKPKFKVGQQVYIVLHTPKTILGKDQNTKQFRNGDVTVTLERHTITDIIYMNGKAPTIRYLIDGYDNVSFTEQQLRSKL